MVLQNTGTFLESNLPIWFILEYTGKPKQENKITFQFYQLEKTAFNSLVHCLPYPLIYNFSFPFFFLIWIKLGTLLTGLLASFFFFYSLCHELLSILLSSKTLFLIVQNIIFNSSLSCE